MVRRPCHAGILNFLQAGPVLVHHPLVVVGGDRGQPLGQQEVHRVAALDLDDVALRADVIHVLDQQQFDAVVLAARQALGAAVLLGRVCLGHDDSSNDS